MSDVLMFNLFRRKKRQWSREAMAGLTQSEVDELNAVLKEYKASLASPDASVSPTTPSKAPRGLRNAAAFYDAVRGSLGGIEQGEVDGTDALLAAMGGAGWPLSWVAYGLATARHETAGTMKPIKEYGGDAYYRRMYDIEGQRPAKARELGNLSPGDGVRFCGRGYVQLTGRTNYLKAGEKVGLDLIADPDLAMQPAAAAKILIWGMETGAFTGKKLADYLGGEQLAAPSEFAQARRIINGQDRANDIAALAMKYQAALQAGGWS